MSCEHSTRLRDFYAGQTYEVEILQVDAEADITGRDYLLTLKRTLELTDAEATGAEGVQVRITATAQDAAANSITLTIVPAASALLSGSYFADVWEIAPGAPPIVTPIIELQSVMVSRGASRAIT